MNHTIAIDFGTSNSSIYIYKSKPELLPDYNGNYLFPSYVEYTKKAVVVGEVAKRNMGRLNHFVVSCVKRLIGKTYDEYEKMEQKGIFGCEVVKGDDNYPRFVVSKTGQLVTCEEVASELFKAIKARADAFNNPNVYDQCYLTVPADYNSSQCDAIARAALMAGITVLKMIPEPSAAAMSYLLSSNIQIDNQEKMIVFDFGGGTFDASLLSYNKESGINGFTVLGEIGRSNLGGNDVDLKIMQYVKDYISQTFGLDLIPPTSRSRQKYNLLKRYCEEAKLTLAITDITQIELDDINEDVEPILFSTVVLNSVIKDLINETVTTVDTLIKKCKLQKGNIKHVFMVGGSSKLNAAQKGMKDYFGSVCDFPVVDPDHCVSLGAMRILKEDLQNSNNSLLKTLQCSYGLGLEDNQVILMLKKGMMAPCISRRFCFSNTEEGQKKVNMKIYQWKGDVDLHNWLQKVSINQCSELYTFSFNIPKCEGIGTLLCDITFALDFGGKLLVQCYKHKQNELLFEHEYNPIIGSFYACLLIKTCFEYILSKSDMSI